MHSHLRSNSIQSGFKSHHSTESALLKVSNDILLETDEGNAVALVLLDLSSDSDNIFLFPGWRVVLDCGALF